MIRARALGWGLACALSCVPLPWLAYAQPGLSGAADAPKKGLSIGVARFERVGPGSADAPDVSLLLADRLATKGVEVVVGPGSLGAPARARPSEDEVKAWASAARVAAIVVGRTTQLGRRSSFDVQLRSGASGASEGTYVAEASSPDEIASAVDQLAGQVVRGLARMDVGASAGSTPPPAARSPGDSSPTPLDLGSLRRDKPISIQSVELEAVQNEGTRRFVFTGNVKVTQEDVSLSADRLEAFYPEGASQPDKLVASGNVVVSQAGRRASCDVATYLNVKQRVLCRGNAEMQQGADRVRGKEIELHLDTHQLFVRGGAEVRITPKPKPATGKDGA